MRAVRKKLCDLNQIEDNDSAAFVVDRDGKEESLMLIRKEKNVFVYLNTCPHIGTPLDFFPGRFLSKDKDFIICSTHGALFRINDGFCISGPCAKQTLTKVSIEIIEGTVFILTK